MDFRRAISAAYYALFHAVLAAAADEFVGKTKRATGNYVLVYRSVDHKSLRELCGDVAKTTPPRKLARFFPPDGFGDDMRAFALGAAELYELRHRADYDPSVSVRAGDAQAAIDSARTALRRFGQVSSQQRKTFLTLLLFPPR